MKTVITITVDHTPSMFSVATILQDIARQIATGNISPVPFNHDRQQCGSFKVEQVDERETITFRRLPSDTNGNPRYWVSYAWFKTDDEIGKPLTDEPRKRANSIGGTTYRGKRFGPGIAIQSYNIQETANQIGDLTGRKLKAERD